MPLIEYFNVPITYFSTDESVSVHTALNNYGIIGHAHAPVTIINGKEI